MLDLRAPDGSNQPVNTQTVQHLAAAVAPHSLAFVDTRVAADWEEAAVVYINGVRQAQLIGNYHHPTMFWLPQVSFHQQVTLAGWHKRSGPAGGSLGMPRGDAFRVHGPSGTIPAETWTSTISARPSPSSQGCAL